MSTSKLYNSLFPSSQKETYYKKLVKDIYVDNKLLKERIKNTFLKDTDPILLAKEKAEDNSNKNKIKYAYRDIENKIRENRKKREEINTNSINSRSVDLLKTYYNLFYSHDKDNSRIIDETAKNRRTFKKLFLKEKGAVLVEDDKSPTYYRRTKKLFPTNPLKESLEVGNTQADAKEHIIDNKGGIMSTKKHYSTNSLEPSQYIKKFNDKQKLLPSEYNERYKSPFNRHVSTKEPNGNQNHKYSFNYLQNKNQRPQSTVPHNSKTSANNRERKKSKYPYVKDHMKELLVTGKTASIKNEYGYTQKVNKNPFDILKKVPKFDWEK